MKSSTVFFGFLTLRLLSVWLVQTSYVPDEYWQSLEVAHSLVFGNGYKTWEWTEGLRSYLYPGIFAVLYKLLSFVGLDTTCTLTLFPRILQAVLSAIADHQFWAWVCGQTGTQGQWATFSLATAWFSFYCGSRTLINTFESALTVIALKAYPWNERAIKGGSMKYLWFVAIVCVTRPTAAIIWLPLCIYHLMSAPNKTIVVGNVVLIGTIVTGTLTLIDSYCYGRLIFTPWNFLKFNVLEGIGSFYGSQPYHWYLTVGIPTVLGLQTLPFLLGVWKTVKNGWSNVESLLLCVIVWTVAVYSLLPHKEFRFLLPLLPMALYISSEWLSRWSRTAKSSLLWLAAISLLAGGIVPSAYFGWVHQQGTLAVMPLLAEDAANSPETTNILFLMPCHSTPYYSHVHTNVPMRFLRCEPNLNSSTTYVDEAELFFLNPARWLEKQYPRGATLPSHVVCFDVLPPQIDNFLNQKEFILQSKLPHVNPMFQTERVGENVLLYKLSPSPKKTEPVVLTSET